MNGDGIGEGFLALSFFFIATRRDQDTFCLLSIPEKAFSKAETKGYF